MKTVIKPQAENDFKNRLLKNKENKKFRKQRNIMAVICVLETITVAVYFLKQYGY